MLYEGKDILRKQKRMKQKTRVAQEHTPLDKFL